MWGFFPDLNHILCSRQNFQKSQNTYLDQGQGHADLGEGQGYDMSF